MMQPTPANWPATGGVEAAKTLRENARVLVDRGIYYPPVLAALAIAEAILGNCVAVERLMTATVFCASSHQ